MKSSNRTIDEHIRINVCMTSAHPQDVDDVVQDTWVKLLQSRGFRTAEKPYAYAAQAARNVVKDRLKRHYALKRDATGYEFKQVDARANPYDALLARERLASAVRGMPAVVREATREAAQGWSVAESMALHQKSHGGIEKRRVLAQTMARENVEGWE